MWSMWLIAKQRRPLSLLQLLLIALAYTIAIHITTATIINLGINKLSYAVSLLYHLYTPDARLFENKSLWNAPVFGNLAVLSSTVAHPLVSFIDRDLKKDSNAIVYLDLFFYFISWRVLFFFYK